MAYICKLQPRSGALSLKKYVQYGVLAGPLLGKLKAGEDVTLDSDAVARSADVHEPDDPGPVFIVVDCPSIEYMPSLLENGKFKRHQKYSLNHSDTAYVVVHFSPKSVTNHLSYKRWINDFSPSTHHLLLNDINTWGSIYVHRIQYTLNMLTPDIFRDAGTEIVEFEGVNDSVSKKMRTGSTETDHDDLDSTSSLPLLSVKSSSTNSNSDYMFANTLFNFQLRPRRGIHRGSELKLIPSQYIEEIMSVDGFKQALQDLKFNLLNKKIGLKFQDYPRVVFLGTGSCIPNKTRNTSAILFDISDSCKIIMDCGEGTYGQLLRFYGPEKALRVLASIKAVYISHLHADHHIGLIGFLQGRRKTLNKLNKQEEPICLLAPNQI